MILKFRKKIPSIISGSCIFMIMFSVYADQKILDVKNRAELVYSAKKLGLAKFLNSDPLNVDKKYLNGLDGYRVLVSDGERLKNYCFYKPEVVYNKYWDRVQAKRVLLTTLQFAGMRVSMKAIAAYSKELNFTSEQYQTVVEKLVGGYCSKNISLISNDELKKYFSGLYGETENKFVLPSIEGNPLFPEALNGLDIRENILNREFLYTVKLFRAFCSWGNDVENLRLLVPLVKNPIIMAWLIRMINNQSVVWDEKSEIAVAKEQDSDFHVTCRQLICRKSSDHVFKETLPRPIGESSIQDDFDRVYCNDFQDAEFTYVNQSETIKKWIDEQSFDEHYLMSSQLVALISKVPDFIIWSKDFVSAKTALKAGMDSYIDRWVKSQSDRFSSDIFYEEPLAIERVADVYYLEPYANSLKIVYDVNLGEFDQNTNMLGKIKLNFNISVEHNFLVEFRAKWAEVAAEDSEKKEYYLAQFIKHIEGSVDKTRDKFKLPIWNKGLVKIIGNALIDHLMESKSSYFTIRKKGFDNLDIELRYGTFALKYLHYKYQTGSGLVESN